MILFYLWATKLGERISTDSIPWAIPEVVEEKADLYERRTEAWLQSCKYPEDRSYDDFARHGRQTHLLKKEVIDKYADYILRLVE